MADSDIIVSLHLVILSNLWGRVTFMIDISGHKDFTKNVHSLLLPKLVLASISPR